MTDVERITTTEREAIMQALYDGKNPPVEWPRECADVVLAMIAAERVRVVEGLVATIKALPHGWVETGVDDGQGHREGFEATEWTRLLAVVEAREDTT